MILKILGTQSPIASKEHNCPGILIKSGKNKLMLDCGSGTHNLFNYPNDLENLTVILTHLHWDHFSDIFNLEYASFAYNNLKMLETPITIYLPLNPINIFRQIVLEKKCFSKKEIIDDRNKLKIGDMEISFCRTDHPIETYAVKVKEGNKSLVYTSDTSFSASKKIAEFAKDTDLLICESSFLKDYEFPEINSHLTAEQAGKIAKMANAKGLMLTHFWHEEKPEKYVEEAKKVFPKVTFAKEGQQINIESRIQEKQEER